MKIKNLTIKKGKKKYKGEWYQFIIERGGQCTIKVRIKTRQGKYTIVNGRRTKYFLLCNGEDFYEGQELDKFERDFPSLSGKVKSEIINNMINRQIQSPGQSPDSPRREN